MATPSKYWIKGISVIVLGYLIFSLSSPLILATEKQPRKIEAPDLILVTIVLMFNSGLLEKLENISFSKDGSFEAKFKQLEAAQEQVKQDLSAKLSTQSQKIVSLEEAIKSYNSREDILSQDPELVDKELALVGLKVRSGDIVDAITPIYAVITPDGELGKTTEGQCYGGTGGSETVLTKNGCVVTGVDIYRGDYFGREEVVQIALVWRELIQQGMDATDITSPVLGSGQYAEAIKRETLRAKPDCYISNFSCDTSFHTSGETFLHNFTIESKGLPTPEVS